MDIVIVGVDCATVGDKVGISFVEIGHRGKRLVEVSLGRPESSPGDQIAKWLQGSKTALIALDAPLGWPLALSKQLTGHSAGSPVGYPRATLRARSLESEGYKRSKGIDLRQSLCAQILQELPTDLDSASLTADDNVFDAVLCALAGIDFVEGRALEPYDRATAYKEGWIWFGRPG